MCAIARGLMSRPQLLLLDEPSLGLAPLMVQHMFKIIREIKEKGVTILLAEQNAFQALDMADQAFVLETGKVIVSGTGQDLLDNPLVQKAYLGVAH
jgi:branched-chain amino acid transport system ATP-binding protein